MSSSTVAPSRESRSLLQGFVLGAAAACTAATFTNPWEVVKTRLQLQGELIKRTTKTLPTPQPRIYNNALHAFWKILRAEGIRGIQRGLVPAYMYQTLMNGTRLGTYEPVKRTLDRMCGALSVPQEVIAVTAGFLCGITGAFIGSPLFLVKIRMQAYSSDPRLASVGYQHNYRNTWHALLSIARSERGLIGWWRGCTASMMRTGVGSAVQLSSYDAIKERLLSENVVEKLYRFYDVNSVRTSAVPSSDDITLHICASLLTGFVVVVFMNPFDVVSTRLYNQPIRQGIHAPMYSGLVDCFAKTVHAEGVAGLYKGLTAHWLRIGPHTILTFVLLEKFRSLARQYWN